MLRYNSILFLVSILFLTSCVHTEVEVNGNIAGSVREKESAKAISGCSISIEPGNNQLYSSEDGSYSFTGLQMGDYTLTASKSGYEILTETITIGAGKTLNHDIMLTPAKAPMVSTDSVTNLLANSATLCGTVVDNGGAAITERGFYYGIDSTKMSIVYSSESSDSIPSFTYNIVDLEDGKIYYYQSFAINEIGEGKGKLKSFSTNELIAPSVKTSSATNIGTTSAILHGEITDRGNRPVTQCGFYLGLDEIPNQKYSYPTNEESALNYIVSNLQCNTTYYYCIFAENEKAESKGSIFSFTTLDISVPTIYTNEATDITHSSAILHATLSDDGGGEIIEYGFYYGQTSSGLQKIKIGSSYVNSFTYDLSGLSSGKIYYYCAYAINNKGESKGLLNSFETNNKSVPIVNTTDVSSISDNSATLNGNINNSELSTLLEYGFYYGTSEQPNQKIIAGEGNFSGNYSKYISNLQPATKYFYQAYAINSFGEGKGSISSFQTMGIPTVDAYSLSLTADDIICIGNVVSVNDIAITEFGICYSTTSNNPTITSSNVIVGSGSFNNYRCSILKYNYGSTYYVRCYAKNSYGVGYSDVLSIQTPAEPELSIVSITSTYDDKGTYTLAGTTISYIYNLLPKFNLINQDNVSVMQIGYYYSAISDNLDIQQIAGTTKNRAVCSLDNSLYVKEVTFELSTYYSTIYMRPYIISRDTIWSPIPPIQPTYNNVYLP